MWTAIEDARFGIRTFRRAPGFTVTVVGTLAVGIAAATIVFTLVNAVLFARFDVYRDPERLVYVLEQNPRTGATGGVSAKTMADWKAGGQSFERMGGVEASSVPLLSHGSEPESVMTASVTSELLALLDASPAAGRLCTDGDYTAPSGTVVLLSYRLWRDGFGSNPDAVGQTVELDGRTVTIVGVLSSEFTLSPFLGSSPDVYVPKGLAAASERSARTLLVIARLGPGASASRARAEIEAVSAALASNDPAARGWSPWLIQPRSFEGSGDAQFLVVLAVGVGLVLAIVCANVAGLVLARSAGRAREIATRLALGAGRPRIARQLLTESLVLGLAAGVAGLFLTWSACRGISWWIADTSLAGLQLTLDRRVLALSGSLSLLMALGAGSLPAARLARLPVHEALSGAATLWGRLSAGRLRRALVAVEVAMAVVLLLCAGLVLRGLVNLRENDPGFQPDGLFTLRLTLSEGRYGDAGKRARFADQLVRNLSSRPSFRSAAITSLMPAIGGEPEVGALAVEGRAEGADANASAGLLSVSPGYFETMKIPVTLGRSFRASDGEGSLPAIVVSQGLVRRWMSGIQPIGARLRVEGVWRTVVGVAGDVRTFHLNVAPRPTIYFPYSQRPVPSLWLLLRSDLRDQAALISEARAEVRAADPGQPVRGGSWAESLVRQSMGGFDVTGLLVGVLAAVAAALAALGVYGMAAFSVARRTRELGVRIALGAEPRQVVRLVMVEASKTALWGAVPGLMLAVASGRLLASRLQRVTPFDPALLAAVAFLVLGTLAAASWAPARRAARVDPAAATRSE